VSELLEARQRAKDLFLSKVRSGLGAWSGTSYDVEGFGAWILPRFQSCEVSIQTPRHYPHWFYKSDNNAEDPVYSALLASYQKAREEDRRERERRTAEYINNSIAQMEESSKPKRSWLSRIFS
jgi:hypothetical protein